MMLYYASMLTRTGIARGSLALFFLVLSGPAWADVTVWQQNLVRADKLISKGTETTDLFFFDRKGGEFSVTVDNATRRIVSFSGKFRGLKRKVFEAMKDRVNSWKEIPGMRQMRMTEMTYAKNGHSDRVLHLDLRGVDLWLTDGGYQSLFDASQVGFRLNLRRTGHDPLSLSVALEVPQGGSPQELKILDSSPL
jgi:hypothetical protein